MSPSSTPLPFTMMTSFFAGDDVGAVKCCVALTFRRAFSSTSKPFGTLLWFIQHVIHPPLHFCTCLSGCMANSCASSLCSDIVFFVSSSVSRLRVVVTSKKNALGKKKNPSDFGVSAFSLSFATL